jgi:hypothetical protein
VSYVKYWVLCDLDYKCQGQISNYVCVYIYILEHSRISYMKIRLLWTTLNFMSRPNKFFSVYFNSLYVKVILHQFWVKKIFPWKFNLEYGSTFTKLFMHVSSRNMFPTTRNLQIHVHVYRPRHCCGDWLTFGCFFPMIAYHDLVKKR